MDPRERLRLALLGSGCARCGRPYPAQGIKVLAQREEIAFVQLVCFSCQIQTLALVTGVRALAEEPIAEDDEASAAPSADRPESRALLGGPAITDDDVLEMHAFLSKYEGGIEGLVRRSGDSSEGRKDDRGGSSAGEGSAG